MKSRHSNVRRIEVNSANGLRVMAKTLSLHYYSGFRIKLLHCNYNEIGITNVLVITIGAVSFLWDLVA